MLPTVHQTAVVLVRSRQSGTTEMSFTCNNTLLRPKWGRLCVCVYVYVWVCVYGCMWLREWGSSSPWSDDSDNDDDEKQSARRTALNVPAYYIVVQPGMNWTETYLKLAEFCKRLWETTDTNNIVAPYRRRQRWSPKYNSLFLIQNFF